VAASASQRESALPEPGEITDARSHPDLDHGLIALVDRLAQLQHASHLEPLGRGDGLRACHAPAADRTVLSWSDRQALGAKGADEVAGQGGAAEKAVDMPYRCEPTAQLEGAEAGAGTEVPVLRHAVPADLVEPIRQLVMIVERNLARRPGDLRRRVPIEHPGHALRECPRVVQACG
jgi:hypothetical protein